MDTSEKLMEFENGDLSPNETIELFSNLVATGLVWQLQGAYGRHAAALIENGYILPSGKILQYFEYENGTFY